MGGNFSSFGLSDTHLAELSTTHLWL